MTSARPKRTRRVRRLALLFFSGFSLISSSAEASDWELLYQLSNTTNGSDNLNLIVDPQGWAGSTEASADLNLKLITKSLTWGLSGSAGYITYFGETDSEAAPSKSIYSSLEKKTRDTDYSLSAFYSIDNVTATDLADVGVTESDNQRLSYGANSGFNHRINARDSLNFGIGVALNDFAETSSIDDVTPNRQVTANLVWNRQYNQRVNGNVKSSLIWYKAEETENLIYTNTVGTDAELTRRLSITANAGATVIDNYRIDTGPNRQRTMIYGFVGNFSLQYRPFNDTTFNVALAQNVSVDDLGDLRASQSFNFGLGYTISDISSINLGGGLSISTGGENNTNPPREVWNISTVYSHKINKRWNSIIGYRYVQSTEAVLTELATSDSNTVFISLSTNGALLP